MKIIFHPSGERGHANHGWLNAHHSFSFANWQNPAKHNFGALRVLNDDEIQAGMGFGTHPHENMEIVTIPLSGAIAHKDSMGNSGTIKAGDVQIMSAGTGVYHSEFNASNTEALNLLQLWVFPKERQITPRYEQKTIDPSKNTNVFTTLVSPDHDGESVWINQDAVFSLGVFDAGQSVKYKMKFPGNGAFIFLIEGDAHAGGQALEKRDGVGIWETDEIAIQTSSASRILIVEVPMMEAEF
jgi:redox-sensitive bicupin YhaK (pirin superfamily)